MAFIRDIIAELRRPSTAAPGPLHAAYERGVIGMAHGILGALLSWPITALGGSHLAAAFAVICIYFVIKEAGDIRRGGTVADGLEDTACVGFGALYSGPIWFPAAMVIIGGFLMWRGYRK